MPWELKNVSPVSRHNEPTKFTASLSAGVLAEMFTKGLIVYEGKIQRGTKTNSKGEEVDIYSVKKIKEIYTAMIEGTLHGAMITLNYPKDAETPLEYNEEEETLTGSAPLQILDGQHRIRACAKWLKDWQKNESLPNPYEFEYPVVVENLNELDAMQLFAEYSLKPTKVSRTRSVYLDVGSLSNYITRNLLKNSQLRGKVECTSSAIRGKNNNIVTFGTLATSINEAFKPSTKEEADNLIDYLTKFYNALINLFPEAMGDIDIEKRTAARKNSIKIEALTWYGYAAIAASLMGDKGWEKKLKKLKEKVKMGEWEGTILDRNCPIWIGQIFRGEDKIINNTSTQSYMASTLSKFIQGGVESLLKKSD